MAAQDGLVLGSTLNPELTAGVVTHAAKHSITLLRARRPRGGVDALSAKRAPADAAEEYELEVPSHHREGPVFGAPGGKRSIEREEGVRGRA